MRALMISCFSVICFNFMQLFFTCIVWSLWLHQNDVIFNDATPDLQGCFYLIFHRLSLWLKIDRNTFAYTRMDLGISSDGIKFWNNRITHSWHLPYFPLFGLCSLSFRCMQQPFFYGFFCSSFCCCLFPTSLAIFPKINKISTII